MLRRPRKAYWVSQKELDYENSDANIQKKEDALDDFFDVGIDDGRRGTGRGSVSQKLEDMDPDRKRETLNKAAVKNTTSEVKTNINNMKHLRVEASGGLDLDATKEKQNYIHQMLVDKQLRQKQLIAKIRAKFEPMQCLQAVADLKIDKKDKVVHFD